MSPEKKVGFVTGGNRGLGLQTAKDLAKLGIAVVIGVRDKKKGEEAVSGLRKEGISIESIQCDVVDAKQHRAAYDYFDRKFGKLDILINNAGVFLEKEESGEAMGSRASEVPVRILKETFEANFFAPIALTQVLLPLVRKSAAGRIVNLSSILGSMTLHADPKSPIYHAKQLGYDASKTAINAFTIHLAHELRATPIKVNSAHPGWVKTDMGGSQAPMEIEDGSKTTVRLATLGADGPTGGFFHMGDELPW
jgi:NAD(P)-dependent dehydrogenase (short-subunit alcohol dehydrogenase family)